MHHFLLMTCVSLFKDFLSLGQGTQGGNKMSISAMTTQTTGGSNKGSQKNEKKGKDDQELEDRYYKPQEHKKIFKWQKK